MANDARKWIPVVLIVCAVAVSAFLLRDRAPTVSIDLRGLLPFELEERPDTAPRWVAAAGMPFMALLIWGLFRLGRTRGALGLTRRLYPDAPEALADPASLDRFRVAYDTIALWVVVLVLGVHAGMMASALGHETLAPKIITVAMGISLVAAGNVIPRLRPNLMAGVRTHRTLTDPHLWRATHRLLGRAFVIAGMITVLVGLRWSAYGLATAVVLLIAACVVALAGGVRSVPSTRASR